ncbi:unnamed protein product [Effrenium voratum]|nr:unnamed protein product [Effrenium voratum]
MAAAGAYPGPCFKGAMDKGAMKGAPKGQAFGPGKGMPGIKGMGKGFGPDGRPMGPMGPTGPTGPKGMGPMGPMGPIGGKGPMGMGPVGSIGPGAPGGLKPQSTGGPRPDKALAPPALTAAAERRNSRGPLMPPLPPSALRPDAPVLEEDFGWPTKATPCFDKVDPAASMSKTEATDHSPLKSAAPLGEAQGRPAPVLRFVDDGEKADMPTLPGMPSSMPSMPSSTPSSIPSSIPSNIPSSIPSSTGGMPNSMLESMPSMPSSTPSSIPSSTGGMPASMLESMPSMPSSTPSSIPSSTGGMPASMLESMPSMPSSIPSTGNMPSSVPSSMPSCTPSSIPSSKPGSMPSSVPSSPSMPPAMPGTQSQLPQPAQAVQSVQPAQIAQPVQSMLPMQPVQEATHQVSIMQPVQAAQPAQATGQAMQPVAAPSQLGGASTAGYAGDVPIEGSRQFKARPTVTHLRSELERVQKEMDALRTASPSGDAGGETGAHLEELQRLRELLEQTERENQELRAKQVPEEGATKRRGVRKSVKNKTLDLTPHRKNEWQDMQRPESEESDLDIDEDLDELLGMDLTAARD